MFHNLYFCYKDFKKLHNSPPQKFYSYKLPNKSKKNDQVEKTIFSVKQLPGLEPLAFDVSSNCVTLAPSKQTSIGLEFINSQVTVSCATSVNKVVNVKKIVHGFSSTAYRKRKNTIEISSDLETLH